MPAAGVNSRVTGLDAGLELARVLFDEIGGATFNGAGITRAAYGPSEDYRGVRDAWDAIFPDGVYSAKGLAEAKRRY